MKRPFSGFIVLVLAGLLAACGSSGPTASGPITVTSREFEFSPAAIEVDAGQSVTFVLVNSGNLEHDFSIMEFPMAGAPAASGGDAHAHDMGHMSEQPELHMVAAAGQRAELELTPTRPGTYEFFCAVPGHKEAGMTGTLVVRAP
jgi:uncharacterized cupredoxin-like copper-binding protein